MKDDLGDLRRFKGLCPLTPAEAEEALKNAKRRRASDEEIDRIIDAVTRGELPETDDHPGINGKAVQAAANPWCPSECPVTGLPFFMWLHHDNMGWVPTYGGPFDSYTIPERDDVENIHGIKYQRMIRLRYDHDAGSWSEWEVIDSVVVSDQALMRVLPDDMPHMTVYIGPYLIVPRSSDFNHYDWKDYVSCGRGEAGYDESELYLIPNRDFYDLKGVTRDMTFGHDDSDAVVLISPGTMASEAASMHRLAAKLIEWCIENNVPYRVEWGVVPGWF